MTLENDLDTIIGKIRERFEQIEAIVSESESIVMLPQATTSLPVLAGVSA
jgi:hypothetical protein